ncbi:hypothetical protein Gorai_000067 [Gossypium raimondii]|uniref:Uncharacterized protein n=1 Tax=Gossypium raimondii TaxID=29730 RepID=A0A7J8PCR5_GOSRA|nr:hypothetical protein [Gossypium raimondii]
MAQSLHITKGRYHKGLTRLCGHFLLM